MYREKRCYNIEALNELDINIPTWVDPEIVANVVAAIVAHKLGIKMDYCYKLYAEGIRLSVINQYEPKSE